MADRRDSSAVYDHHIGVALEHLKRCLKPFIDTIMTRRCLRCCLKLTRLLRYGDDWQADDEVEEILGKGSSYGGPKEPRDLPVLLNVLWYFWEEVFGAILVGDEKYVVLELKSLLRRYDRHEKFTDEDTSRALDTVWRMLKSLPVDNQGLSRESADEVHKLKTAILNRLLDGKDDVFALMPKMRKSPYEDDSDAEGSSRRKGGHATEGWADDKKPQADLIDESGFESTTHQPPSVKAGKVAATQQAAQRVVGFVQATYKYDASEEYELSFPAGAVIQVTDKHTSGWWEGRYKDAIGVFPSTYVREIDEETAKQLQSAPSSVRSAKSDASDNNKLGYVQAAFKYTAGEDYEISFDEGAVIQVTDKHPSGWWEGRCNGRMGVFPRTYVKEIPDAEAKKLLAALSSGRRSGGGGKGLRRGSTGSKHSRHSSGSSSKIARVGRHGSVTAASVHTAHRSSSDGGHGLGSSRRISAASMAALSMHTAHATVGSGTNMSMHTAHGASSRATAGSVHTSHEVVSKASSGAGYPSKRSEAAVLMRVTATHDYVAREDNELSFAVGASIQVLERDESGWWLGRIGSQVGLFPSTFTKDKSGTAIPPPPGVAKAARVAKSGTGGQGSVRSSKGAKRQRRSTKRSSKKAKASDAPNPNSYTAPPVGAAGGDHPVIVRALFDFVATEEGELTIRCDDIIKVLEEDPSGWFLGECNGVQGLFPSTYTETVV